MPRVTLSDEAIAMLKAPSLEKATFASALNARGPRHVGLKPDESYILCAQNGKVMAIVLRGVLRPHAAALMLLRTAHKRSALCWPCSCEADLIPDFERVQSGLKRFSTAAAVKVVQGFEVHKIGFRGDNQ
jgi:hypothetical protein